MQRIKCKIRLYILLHSILTIFTYLCAALIRVIEQVKAEQNDDVEDQLQ